MIYACFHGAIQQKLKRCLMEKIRKIRWITGPKYNFLQKATVDFLTSPPDQSTADGHKSYHEIFSRFWKGLFLAENIPGRHAEVLSNTDITFSMFGVRWLAIRARNVSVHGLKRRWSSDTRLQKVHPIVREWSSVVVHSFYDNLQLRKNLFKAKWYVI